MDEYISREKVLKKLQMQLLDLESNQDKGEYSELCENRGARDALDEAIYDIRTIKAADVQPVNQWISVDDSLPPDNMPCVVVTKNNGLGVSRLMGRNKLEWTLFGKPVLYWMPVPEPPKDGDEE